MRNGRWTSGPVGPSGPSVADPGHTAAPEPVAAGYSEITGVPVPDWMKETLETA
jgi:hypothetical protein